jgi:mannosyltransferase OCH1-like enzyme
MNWLRDTPLESWQGIHDIDAARRLLPEDTEPRGKKYTYLALLSDIMRVAVLFKYGGIYLDFDSLMLRPWTLGLNTLGLANTALERPYCTTSAFAFRRRHPILKKFLENMKKG